MCPVCHDCAFKDGVCEQRINRGRRFFLTGSLVLPVAAKLALPKLGWPLPAVSRTFYVDAAMKPGAPDTFATISEGAAALAGSRESTLIVRPAKYELTETVFIPSDSTILMDGSYVEVSTGAVMTIAGNGAISNCHFQVHRELASVGFADGSRVRSLFNLTSSGDINGTID